MSAAPYSQVPSFVKQYGILKANPNNFSVKSAWSMNAMNLTQASALASAVSNFKANNPKSNIELTNLSFSVPYGQLMYSGAYVRAGQRKYYAIYSATQNVFIYNITVVKAVPNLDINIGRAISNSSTPVSNFLFSSFSYQNGTITPLSTYQLQPTLESKVLGNNILQYSYSIYIGGHLVQSSNPEETNLTNSFNFDNIPINEQSEIVFNTGGNANYTSVDPTVYYTSANSVLEISSTETLASDLICGSLEITSTGTLITDGYSILCANSIINDGTINTGNPGNGGTGASGAGGSYTNSYAGSGGGGGATGGTGSGSSGKTPTVPTLSNSLIQTWYGSGNTNFINYNSGAGGGANGDGVASGGSGSYGLYMQANTITVGTITATGISGASETGSDTAKNNGGSGGSTIALPGAGGSVGGKPANAGAGGGGGGFVLIAYGKGTLSIAGVSVTGGAAGTGSNNGGPGGAGNIKTFSFGSLPPIAVLPQPTASCTFTINSISITFPGNISPGGNTGTESNTILISNTGSASSNVLISGTSWSDGTSTFGVTNTVWSTTSSTPYSSGTPITSTATDTNIQIAGGTSNTISFGLGIPAGQSPGTYAQTITLTNTC
jgi:hypothetical protein